MIGWVSGLFVEQIQYSIPVKRYKLMTLTFWCIIKILFKNKLHSHIFSLIYYVKNLERILIAYR